MARKDDYSEYFGQTSKTILFERFAKEDHEGNGMPNLAFLLNEWDNQVKNGKAKDEILDEIEKELGVRSFQEFLEKFTPNVYEEVFEEKNTGEIKVVYSLERPEGWDDENTPVSLDLQPLYRMVEQLYETRKSSGQPLNKYDFGDVTKLLSPRARQEEYKRLRSALSYQNARYYQLEEKNPGVNTPEKEDCIEAITNARLDFASLCQSGITETFALQLQDAQQMLLETKKLSDDSKNGEKTEYVRGLPVFTEEGDIKIKPIEKKEEAKALELKDDPEMLLLEILKDDFKAAAPKLAESKEITNLVVSAISKAEEREKLSVEEAKKRIEDCENRYKAWNESLTDVLFPVIEKFIGVKAFFDNATAEGKLDNNNVLIVANCTAEELTKVEIKDKFEKFLEAMNGYRGRKIWFGIIPAIALGNERVEERLSDQSNSGPYRPLIMDKKEKKVSGLVPADSARELMWMCEKQQIMVFYNYKANDKTSLGGLTKDAFDQMRDKINFAGTVSEGATGEYAVCALPNFTLLPKRKAYVVLNQELVDAEVEKKESRLQLKGIYVDAAYVAAGMVVGSQQYDVLRSKDLPADRRLTGIRVDFENSHVSQKFLSSMCIENLTPIDKKIENAVMETRFGFYFSDPAITNESGSKILRCYVKNARTMQEKKGKYRKMNNVLFNQFINLCACDGESLSDETKIRRFLDEDVPAWSKMRQQQEEKEEKDKLVNLLLNDGESIELNAKDNSLIDITYPQDKDFVKIRVEEKTTN